MNDWTIAERRDKVFLEDKFGNRIVVSRDNAIEIWRVLNKWIEANAEKEC